MTFELPPGRVDRKHKSNTHEIKCRYHYKKLKTPLQAISGNELTISHPHMKSPKAILELEMPQMNTA